MGYFKHSILGTERAINEALQNKSNWMPVDGIQMDMDGKSLANWLTKCGYTVEDHRDTGFNGVVELSNGICVSTNGWTHKFR